MTIAERRMWPRHSLLAGLAVAAHFIPVLPGIAAEHSIPKQSNAKTFVESIYQHYVGSSDDSAKGVLLASANSVRPYFTFGTVADQ